MPKQYSPKSFFRQALNCFLQQYFASKNVLKNFDFSAITETKIELLYEAWLELPEDTRTNIEQDFQAIHDMATEGGSKAIIDVANHFGENLALQFSELKGFHEHAFWTFLERQSYWQIALTFAHADSIADSYWRKRKNMPLKDANIDPDSIKNFESILSNYFYRIQGRGKNCKIEYYKRNELDYFFAYPEDYAQANIEWEKNEFKRRSYHPAFEVIFVYSKANRTLDTFITGDKKIVSDLQAIFSTTILKAELEPDEKDQRVYDLSGLKTRYFPFIYDINSGISNVNVKKLRLVSYDKKEKIVLEADTTDNRYAVYDLLDKLTKFSSIPQFLITQVGFKVTFIQNPASRKSNTCSFTVTYPNSCSLKYDEKSLLIRKMLADSGIEPRILQPANEPIIA